MAARALVVAAVCLPLASASNCPDVTNSDRFTKDDHRLVGYSTCADGKCEKDDGSKAQIFSGISTERTIHYFKFEGEDAVDHPLELVQEMYAGLWQQAKLFSNAVFGSGGGDDDEERRNDDAEGFLEHAKKSFLRLTQSWYALEFQIVPEDYLRGGKRKLYTYLLNPEVKATDQTGAWQYVSSLQTAAGDGIMSGLGLDMIEHACMMRTGNTTILGFPQYEDNGRIAELFVDRAFMFPHVGHSEFIAFECTEAAGDQTEECLDADEIHFDPADIKFNVWRFTLFIVGILLIFNSSKIAESQDAFYVFVASFFTAGIVAYLGYNRMKANGAHNKLLAGTIWAGLSGIVSVVRTKLSFLFSIVASSFYLQCGLVVVFFAGLFAAMHITAGEPNGVIGGGKKRVFQTVIIITGVMVVSANEPSPWTGVSIGLAAAVGSYISVVVAGIIEHVMKLKGPLAMILTVVMYVVKLVLLPFKAVWWIIKTLWGIFRYIVPASTQADPTNLRAVQTMDEYRQQGSYFAAYFVGELKKDNIEGVMSPAYKRTKHFEETQRRYPNGTPQAQNPMAATHGTSDEEYRRHQRYGEVAPVYSNNSDNELPEDGGAVEDNGDFAPNAFDSD